MTGFFMSKRRTDVPFRERLKCSIKEAEQYGGLGNTIIWQLINQGRIKTSKVGSKVLIDVPSYCRVLDGEDQQQSA